MKGSFSYSALGTFQDCPLQFKFKYIDKVERSPSVSAAQYLGTAIHRVLRQLYECGADGVLVPLDEVKRAYDADWEKVDKHRLVVTSDHYTIDDYIRIGREMLVRHYERYQPFNQATLLGAELKLRFDLPGTSFRMSAIIDRLQRLDDGTVEICDYKTGQNIAQPNSPQFVNQMGLYQLAVQAAYPDYKRIVLSQHFLRRDEIVRHSLSAEEIDLLVEQVRLTIHETINAQRLGDHPAQEGGHCNFCDYASICPKKRHGILLEQTGDQVDLDDASIADRATKLANAYLDTHQKVSQYKAELDSLKADIIEAAREFNLTRLEGINGNVTVRLGQREKFVTRTKDASRFAELSATARELGLDHYFIPDTYRLMKEIINAGRLDPEAMDRLRPFIEQVEENRIYARFNASSDRDD